MEHWCDWCQEHTPRTATGNCWRCIKERWEERKNRRAIARLKAEVEGLHQLLRAIRKTVPMHSSHKVVADRIDTVLAASGGGERKP